MWSYEGLLFWRVVEFIYTSCFASLYLEPRFDITIRSLSSHHSNEHDIRSGICLGQ